MHHVRKGELLVPDTAQVGWGAPAIAVLQFAVEVGLIPAQPAMATTDGDESMARLALADGPGLVEGPAPTA